MCSRNYRRMVLSGFTALLACGVLVSRADAQNLGNVEDTSVPFRKDKEQFEKYRDAKDGAIPDPAKDKAMLEVASRYFVYRVTWKKIQDEKWSSSSGMEAVLKDFKDLMTKSATEAGSNKDFMKMLVPELIARFKDVFAVSFEQYKTGVTNAALMLPMLAKCKQPAVHDYLIEVVTKPDPKTGKPFHPFIRMCAVKGLAELNNPGPPQLDDPTAVKDQNAKATRDIASLEALVKFIDQPYSPEGKGQEYEEALAFVRREGVKALTQLPLPLHYSKKVIECPVAYHLLKIANGGTPTVGPPFTLSERVEAAIGLCNLKIGDPQLKAANAPQLNADLTTYVVANTVYDFITEYTKDYGIFKTPPKNKDDAPIVPRLPWRSYAARLDKGLEDLGGNLKGTPAGKKVDDLRGSGGGAKAILDIIYKSQQPVELTRVLPDYVATMRPANVEVYKDSKEFVLPLADK